MDNEQEKPKRKYKTGRVARRPMKKKGEREKKITSDKKIVKKKPNGYKVYTRKVKNRKVNAKKIVVRVADNPYKDLKYLGFVQRYICEKYDLDQKDFIFGLFLYESRTFTWETFIANVKMIFGKTRGEFKKFLTLGYIRPIRAKIYAPRATEPKHTITDSYMLSLQFRVIITEYYELILKFSEADKGLDHSDFNTDEVMGLVYRMEKELKAIKNGTITIAKMKKETELDNEY